MPDETLQELPSFTLGDTKLIMDSPVFDGSNSTKPNSPPDKKPEPVSDLYSKLKEACHPSTPKPPSQKEESPRPTFDFSIDGPLMGEVEKAAPSLGQRMLDQLNSAVLTNTMDATAAREMASLVESWQTRLDLAGVGVAAYGMSRIQSVTQMTEDIERHIWARLSELPVMEAINLLKVLHKDRLAFVGLLGSRASNPTISSPEALSGGLAGKAEEASKPRVSTVKPEGRKRLHLMLAKVRKTLEVNSQVIEVPLDVEGKRV